MYIWPPRQKQELYGALKRAVKILWILPLRKQPWNFALKTAKDGTPQTDNENSQLTINSKHYNLN